jgi:bifunctional non-homologous end joining protein LigD
VADLDKYYAKRSGDRTPEPYGGTQRGAGTRAFVVQKHAARRLHYDLRLEMDGVLKSWAVPRGPSFDPAVKRLAVMTEDHPLDYKDFEGVIPAGNYGAGAMIVWDRGTWIPIEEKGATLEEGKLLFELKGQKLRGVFTLVKTKGESNEWLLIKKPDAWAAEEGTRQVSSASILSGLTVEDLARGRKTGPEIVEQLEAIGAPKLPVDFENLEAMKAATAEGPFSKPGWLFELKYDGFRLLVEKDGSRIRLRYRSGKDATDVYPDLVVALRAFPFDHFILDAEVVVLDDDSKPSFSRLQKRTQLVRKMDIDRASISYPATLYVFDLLAFEGFDLRGLPLVERKAALRKVILAQGVLRFSDHIETRGEDFFAQVEKMGLEGIVAKRADSKYIAGRSQDWLKLRVEQSEDFVVVGFTEPKRDTRTGFSGLLLGEYVGHELRYVGSVGSGFTEQLLTDIRAELDAITCDTPQFTGDPIPSDRNRWVEPKLVVEVRYLAYTDERQLRHPVFIRLRDDKSVAEMKDDDPDLAPTAPQAPATEEAAAVRVPFTNLDKVFWPEEGYTKGDLIEFYRAISANILPYLEDRPVVLTRYPDGIDGKNFFQKDAPGHIPGWVRTERMWSEHASREIDYFVADDEDTLLYIINLGSIPLHVWSSRVSEIGRPDWTILDLDPKGAPFTDVVKIALAIKALCDDIGLPCYPKTSGSTGLHVLVPLGRQCTYEQSRGLAELIARIIVEELSDIATVARNINARGGKVYIDFGQNGHGRLLVSPLCVRPRPGATVSTPLTWDEVTLDLDPDQFTIRTVPERLAAQDHDPLRAIFDDKPDLAKALAKLSKRM